MFASNTYDDLADNLAVLDIEMPSEAVEAADRAQRGEWAARALDPTPAPLDPAVLLGKDPAAALAKWGAQHAAVEPARQEARRMADALAREREAAVRRALPQVRADLTGWLSAHLQDVLIASTGQDLRPSEDRHYAALVGAFTRAVRTSVGPAPVNTTPGGAAGEYVLYFEWSPQQWDELVGRTLAGLEPYRGQSLWSLARDIGATPGIAESWRDVEQRARALHGHGRTPQGV